MRGFLTEAGKSMFRITDIDRLRIRTDGAGIRTLIVTHGCPLRCRYCTNPQTRSTSHRFQKYTAAGLYEEIILDRPYFLASGGGVTFGGGEPLLYAADLLRFAELVRGEFTLFAETSLAVPKRKLKAAAACVDHFIVDIKTADEEQYAAYTGGTLSLALRNLEFLLETAGKERITVRIPEIPGYTSPEDQERTKEKLESMGLSQFDLFRYVVFEKERTADDRI
jgi:pyruvate formate lyase activating enzyme